MPLLGPHCCSLRLPQQATLAGTCVQIATSWASPMFTWLLPPGLAAPPLQWCTADFGGVRTPNATALMLVGGLPGLYCRSSRLAHQPSLLDAARGF